MGCGRIHIAGAADISTLSSTKVQQQPSIAFDQQTHPVVKTSNHELFVVGHDQPNMCPAQDWASQLEIQSFSEAQLTCHASKEADPWTDHACTSPIHRNAPMEHKRTALQKQATKPLSEGSTSGVKKLVRRQSAQARTMLLGPWLPLPKRTIGLSECGPHCISC